MPAPPAPCLLRAAAKLRFPLILHYPYEKKKKGPERFCILSPVRSGRIQHLSECFPRSGLFSAPGRSAAVRMLLSLPPCPQHPLLLPVRPFSSLRCKAGRCGHPLSRLLLKAPSPPSPLLPGLPVELFFSLCISQQLKGRCINPFRGWGREENGKGAAGRCW